MKTDPDRPSRRPGPGWKTDPKIARAILRGAARIQFEKLRRQAPKDDTIAHLRRLDEINAAEQDYLSALDRDFPLKPMGAPQKYTDEMIVRCQEMLESGEAIGKRGEPTMAAAAARAADEFGVDADGLVRAWREARNRGK
jgi:hypothetical protein